MCARLTITIPKEEVKKYLYDYFSINFPDDLDYSPRYNAAPGQNILTVISDGEHYRCGYLKWGFIPHFAKDEALSLINAKAETIDTKTSFRDSFRKKRCIILADGYYEWKDEGNGKTPYRILLKDKNIFQIAGLWSTYIKEDGSKVFTCTVITTEANDLTKDIHDRMPVILDKDASRIWLSKDADEANLKQILLPYDENKMDYYPVSKAVNSSRFDYPELINKI